MRGKIKMHITPMQKTYTPTKSANIVRRSIRKAASLGTKKLAKANLRIRI